ncbi:M20 metallopeptidase family protein [Clostridium guangxiense]|uniref:M20 metallopeptidase family protein n=1 Tax=Clostridium guangxiense TaxID=1662055 RepID=UPI001E460EC5|nr:M20 family metallopeptidase [Clostridium guangxiense]MCD2348301.1 M20 family metallopeptidase [Clostridium guangxiense]
MNTLDEAKKIEKWIVEIRRDFHMNPEPSFKEIRTCKIVKEKLIELGIEVSSIGKTGISGILKGKNPGKTIALRADMDALSVAEETNLSFKSKNLGFMHACGHDAHMAMLLGAAKILTNMKDEIDGNVKFIFQPAEEASGGSTTMIENGVLENPKVDMIYGMHIFSLLECGKAAVMEGSVMSAVDAWELTIKGKSCHGSTPWDGHDAVMCAVAVISGLQTIVSRVNDARNPIGINVGTINGGERSNVIPGKVKITGSNRAFTQESHDMLPTWMEKIIKSTCEAYDCEYDFMYKVGCDAVTNHKNAVEFVRESVKKVMGDENVVKIPQRMSSDDFGMYLKKVPGMYMFLGAGNQKKGCCHPHHSNNFMIDEDSLIKGAACHAQVAIDFLK